MDTIDGPAVEDSSDTCVQSLGKHAAGTALVTVLGAAGGALYGMAKGSSKANIAIGASFGLLASLGFGKTVYDSTIGPLVGEGHVDRLQRERASTIKRTR